MTLEEQALKIARVCKIVQRRTNKPPTDSGYYCNKDVHIIKEEAINNGITPKVLYRILLSPIFYRQIMNESPD